MLQDNEQWVDYVYDVLGMINTRFGCFAVLPFSGGYLEQPYRTMKIYELIIGQYRKNLSKISPTVI